MHRGIRYYVGLALLAGLAAVLFGLQWAVLLHSSLRFAALVLNLLGPLFLLCTLTYMAAWARHQRITEDDVLVLGLWFLTGATVFAAASTATLYYQLVLGGRIVSFGPAVLNWTISGGAFGLLGGYRNLRQQLAQRELRTARQRASVLNRVLRHDIRNGLNVIVGYLDRLRAETADEEHALAVIRARAETLYQVAERARLIEEAQDKAPTTVDIAASVRSHTDRLAREYPDARIDSIVPRSATVTANPAIESALWEPIENAVIHNDQSPPRVTVEVTPTPDEEQVVVRVGDDGPGLPELEHVVFGDAPESQLVHSRGMGLWFLRIMVEESAGRMALSESDTGGALVTVSLPQAGGPTPHERRGTRLQGAD